MDTTKARSEAAAALARARAASLTPERRREIALKAAAARWNKEDPEPDPTGTDPSNVRSLADAAKKRGRKLNPPAAPVSASEAGRRGGKARAAKLTPEQLSAQGQAAADARWRIERERRQQSCPAHRVAAAWGHASANAGHAYPVAA